MEVAAAGGSALAKEELFWDKLGVPLWLSERLDQLGFPTPTLVQAFALDAGVLGGGRGASANANANAAPAEEEASASGVETLPRLPDGELDMDAVRAMGFDPLEVGNAMIERVVAGRVFFVFGRARRRLRTSIIFPRRRRCLEWSPLAHARPRAGRMCYPAAVTRRRTVTDCGTGHDPAQGGNGISPSRWISSDDVGGVSHRMDDDLPLRT